MDLGISSAKQIYSTFMWISLHLPRANALFPLIFEFLLLLIYALNSILSSDFEPSFLPIISFIKISVAENVAKVLVE